MIEKNDILTLDDNKDYSVVDVFDMEDKKYAYLFEVENPSHLLCVKIENGELIPIDNEKEFIKFMEKVNENN